MSNLNTFEHDKVVFESSHSQIFAPFMIHVLICLINNVKDPNIRKYNAENEIGKWCGGLMQLIECLQEKTFDWNKLVTECVRQTNMGLNSSLWKNLLFNSRVDQQQQQQQQQLSGVEIGVALLNRWKKNGELHRTPGPYPTPEEQQLFLDTAPENIVGILNEHIANGAFKSIYTPTPAPITSYDQNNINRGNINPLNTNQSQNRTPISNTPIQPKSILGRKSYYNPNMYPTYPVLSRAPTKQSRGTLISQDSLKPRPFSSQFGDHNPKSSFPSTSVAGTGTGTATGIGTDVEDDIGGGAGASSSMARNNLPWSAPNKKIDTRNSLTSRYELNRRQDQEHNKFGKLIYQTEYYTEEQMSKIHRIYINQLSRAPKVVFGDNDVDRNRPIGRQRTYNEGQAQVVGPYDREFGYGITTSFYGYINDRLIDLNQYRELLKREFEPLAAHLQQGCDVIFPAPSLNMVYSAQGRQAYSHPSNPQKQIIFHNVGTGVANLPLPYLQAIQDCIDALKPYAESEQLVRVYNVEPLDSNTDANISQARLGSRLHNISPKQLFPMENKSEEEETFRGNRTQYTTLSSPKRQYQQLRQRPSIRETSFRPETISFRELPMDRTLARVVPGPENIVNTETFNIREIWDKFIKTSAVMFMQQGFKLLRILPWIVIILVVISLPQNGWEFGNDQIAWTIVALFLMLLVLLFDRKN